MSSEDESPLTNGRNVEEEEPELNGTGLDEDEDDIQTGHRRKTATKAQLSDEEEADDLFGDEDDELPEEPAEPIKRTLDDEELDSGDDQDRMDRVADDADDQVQYEEQERLAMDVEIPRQALPEPSDGEMYLLKIPDFLSIEPHAWQVQTFQPPTTDHHSKTTSSTFSAYNVALSTIRWRHSPSNPTDLQSNARINRWSDGSLTLQLASDPTVQYEIDGNALAPPQRNPLKPTPTSTTGGRSAGRAGMPGTEERYDRSKDANTFLVTPIESAEMLRVTHKITAGLTVKQTASATDDAIERLQAALASAANASKVAGATGAIEITREDPELGRKRAEELERQLIKDRKKRENALERERARADRTLGGRGLSSGRFGGLNVDMLEDEEESGMDGERGGRGGGMGRARGAKQTRRRRNSEYSEDEDFGRKRFTREDSYDQEDDFLAPSDEEEEIVEDDDDEDDGILEDDVRERSPKRERATTKDEDADADGELEDEDEVQQVRTKRRRVVDDDDEE